MMLFPIQERSSLGWTIGLRARGFRHGRFGTYSGWLTRTENQSNPIRSLVMFCSARNPRSTR
jgi:hypothetical protein